MIDLHFRNEPLLSAIKNRMSSPILIGLLLLLGLLFISPLAYSQSLALIPKPVEMERGEGSFTLLPDTKIVVSSEDFIDHGILLAEGLGLAENNIILADQLTAEVPYISIKIEESLLEKEEGYYEIEVLENTIAIRGSKASVLPGAIYRLVQLSLLQDQRSLLPAVKIKDYPRFEYRGMHLDVSRHFFPMPFLEKMIDMMAIYQLNTFHWHLTDGPGWRLEIKSFPKLTGQAAFRTHYTWKDWWASGRKYLEEGDPQAYGGYYSQKDARQLVAYARERGITIIPEIEFPGHSEEVLAVYPELACSGEPYSQSEFCMGKEATFDFFEQVLLEVMDIFPSQYIHIGGDEANKSAWKKCPHCQKRMKEEHLEDEEELQSYGVHRIEEFLNSNGRNLIGWDEILEGGLPPRATVMSWRGISGGVKAAQNGHEVIMTPGSHCYFDSYQSDPSTQPEAIGGFLPIEKVYSYEPIPADLEAHQRKLVKGVQANLWTEYIPSREHAEYMLFPRLLALSEVAWTKSSSKDWEDFFERLQDHYRLLQRKGINYYHPSVDLTVSALADTARQASLVTISSELYQPIIRFTTDGSTPNINSRQYQAPFYEAGTQTIKAAIQISEKEMGPVAETELGYHKAVGAEVQYLSEYSSKYSAQGDYTLVNGSHGGFTYSDGQWQGFEGKDLDILVDLKKEISIDEIKITFMQLIGPGVFLPGQLEISTSTDGSNFSEPIIISHRIPDTDSDLIIHPFTTAINKKARYIKVKATNSHNGFLFADELMVY